MQTTAVILSGPRDLGLGCLGLVDPTKNDLVVEIAHSGISTGTEKLFWSGTMPPFPGMGYPLVPGYEAAGEVVEAAPETGFTVGDYVFVPGANCFAPGDRGGDKNHRDRCREMTEIRYDMSDHTPVTEGVARDATDAVPTVGGVGMGCHAGPATMAAAARVAGNSELLDQYAADYPVGPHDKPQSMCPAFGSLRVGLRMWRVATLLSGSACCVYGLTFVSHFYGARRSVGYVPFNSESLVTGKLFEDIRDAVHEIADPANYDAVVVTNLCVPTASGVPLKLLPTQINGVRIVGIDVPGIGIPTHAEAKDVLAGAMLKYARAEIEAGPVVPCREWRELYAALDSDVVAAVHPFYTAAVREFQAAGRKVVGSAPVGRDGTMAWLAAIGDAYGISGDKIAATQNVFFPAITEAWTAKQIKGRITLSGYEGSELLVARLLIESGADVLYVGTACARTPWSEPDREWLESKGVAVKYRASLEDDCAAMEGFRPDLAIGITPVVQKGKQLGIPSLYFTNLISARPLMGPAGAGSLADVINGAIGNSARMEKMKGFFEGVGVGDTAGIWEGSPNLRPDYRAAHQKKIDKAAKLAKAEEMI